MYIGRRHGSLSTTDREDSIHVDVVANEEDRRLANVAAAMRFFVLLRAAIPRYVVTMVQLQTIQTRGPTWKNNFTIQKGTERNTNERLR